MAGACSGDDDEPFPAPAAEASRTPVDGADLGPFSLDTEGMAGPGTPLGGGLDVPEGAILLGVPFPDLVGDGYRALLLIPGDAVEVFSTVSEQAGGLGMDADGGCVNVGERVACAGRFVDRADGESLTVELTRQVAFAGVVSGMTLRYRPPGSADAGSEPPATAPAPTAPVPPLMLPDGPIEGPADDDVARAVRAPDDPAPTLEVGSRLVGLPGPCPCAGDGWSFVVELDGVARDVVAAYARQFSDLGEVQDISDQLRDEVTILGVRVGEDSPVAEVRAVVPDSGTAYAIVTYATG